MEKEKRKEGEGDGKGEKKKMEKGKRGKKKKRPSKHQVPCIEFPSPRLYPKSPEERPSDG